MNNKNISFLLIILVFLISCSTQKEVIKPVHQKRIRPISDKKLLKKITKNYINYNYLTVKFSGKAQWDNTSKSIRGIIKTKRDSVILISIYHSSGIPVAKTLLTKDSVIFLNRLNNTYYIGNYNFLEEYLNFSLTFNNIQAILFNEIFLYNDTIVHLKELKDFKRYSDSTCYILQSVKKRAFKKYYKKQNKNKRPKRKWRTGFIVQDFNILPDTFKIKKISIKDISNHLTFSAEYDNFMPFYDKLFPQNMKIDILTPKDTIITTLKFKKVTKNDFLNFSFKIPSKASKIE